MSKFLKSLFLLLTAGVFTTTGWAETYTATNVSIATGTDGGTYDWAQFKFTDAQMVITNNHDEIVDASAVSDILDVTSVAILRRSNKDDWATTITAELRTTDGGSILPNGTSESLTMEEVTTSNGQSVKWMVFTFKNPVRILKNTIYRIKTSSGGQQYYMSNVPGKTGKNNTSILANNSQDNHSPFIRVVATSVDSTTVTREIVGMGKKWSDSDWDPVTPTSTSNVTLAVDGESSLEMDTPASVFNLTIKGVEDGNEDTLTIGGSEKLTATATTVGVNTTVNAGAANLGTVTINAEKTLTVKENPTNVYTSLTNNGVLCLDGGNASTPLTINNNNALGKVLLADGAVVKMTATGGNKIYNIEGVANAKIKPELRLHSNQGWGVDKTSSALRNVKLVIPEKNTNDESGVVSFWLTPARVADDYSVDLVILGTQTLTLENTDAPIKLGNFETNGPVSGTNARVLDVKTGAMSGSGSCTSPLLVSDSGEGTFTIARAYGAALTIGSNGSVTVAEGGSLTGTVSVTGTLTYATDATPTNTITNNGMITADTATVDLTGATITGSGTYGVTNNGTLILSLTQTEGKTISVADGAKLQVKLSDVEKLSAQSVTIDGTGTVQFVGENGDVLSELDNESQVDSTYKPVIPEYTYTVAQDGAGAWNNTPTAGAKITIAFGETEGKTVDLSAILGDVTSVAELIVTGKNGGTIEKGNNTLVVAVLNLQTNVTVTGAFLKDCVAAHTTVNVPEGKTLSISVPNGETDWDCSLKHSFGGAGTVKKMGAGSLSIEDAYGASFACAPTLVVAEGAFRFGSSNTTNYTNPYNIVVENGATLKLGYGSVLTNANTTITLNDGAILEAKNGNNNTATAAQIVVNGNATINGSMYGNHTTFNGRISGNGTLTVANIDGSSMQFTSVIADKSTDEKLKVVVNHPNITFSGSNSYTGGTEIATGAKLINNNGSALGAGKVAGSGTLTINIGKHPGNREEFGFAEAGWTGTIEFTGGTFATSVDFTKWQNANSTFKVASGAIISQFGAFAGTLIGAGTINNSLTFADNATLDATTGILTANTLAALPANLKVKVATAPAVGVATPILKTTAFANTLGAIEGTNLTVMVGDNEDTTNTYRLAGTPTALLLDNEPVENTVVAAGTIATANSTLTGHGNYAAVQIDLDAFLPNAPGWVSGETYALQSFSIVEREDTNTGSIPNNSVVQIVDVADTTKIIETSEPLTQKEAVSSTFASGSCNVCTFTFSTPVKLNASKTYRFRFYNENEEPFTAGLRVQNTNNANQRDANLLNLGYSIVDAQWMPLYTLTAERMIDTTPTLRGGDEPLEVNSVPEKIRLNTATFAGGYGTVYTVLNYTGVEVPNWDNMVVEGLPSGVEVITTDKTWGFVNNCLKVLPIGDSITAGLVTYHNSSANWHVAGGYRLPLYQYLTQAYGEGKVKYLGTSTYRTTDTGDNSQNSYEDRDIDSVTLTKVGQLNHEGHSGATLDGNNCQMYDRFKNQKVVDIIATQGAPDVITLHLGTNDFGMGGDTVDTAKADMKKLLFLLNGSGAGEDGDIPLYPNATIFVAKIIPRSGSITTNKLKPFNEWLTTYVNELNSDKLVLVDLNMACNYGLLRHDGLHPSTEGYSHMAQNWFVNIEATLPPMGAVASIDTVDARVANTLKVTTNKAINTSLTQTWTLNKGATVTAAKITDDKRTVILTVEGVVANTEYTLMATNLFAEADSVENTFTTTVDIHTPTTDVVESDRAGAVNTAGVLKAAEWTTFAGFESGYTSPIGYMPESGRPWQLDVRGSNVPTVKDGVLSLNGAPLTVNFKDGHIGTTKSVRTTVMEVSNLSAGDVLFTETGNSNELNKITVVDGDTLAWDSGSDKTIELASYGINLTDDTPEVITETFAAIGGGYNCKLTINGIEVATSTWTSSGEWVNGPWSIGANSTANVGSETMKLYRLSFYEGAATIHMGTQATIDVGNGEGQFTTWSDAKEALNLYDTMESVTLNFGDKAEDDEAMPMSDALTFIFDGDGDVTIDSLTVVGSNGGTITKTGTGAVTATTSTTINTNVAIVGQIQLDGITINEGAELAIAHYAVLGDQVSGAGTLKITRATSWPFGRVKKVGDADAWTGTVVLENIADSNLDVGMLVNEASSLTIEGEVKTYFFDCAMKTLTLNGTYQINGGTSNETLTQCLRIATLVGEGTFKGPEVKASNAKICSAIHAADISGFTGSIDLSHENAAKTAVFLGAAPERFTATCAGAFNDADSQITDADRGTIYVDGVKAMVAAGKTWSAASGKSLHVTASATIAGSGTVSALTLEAGATIEVTGANALTATVVSALPESLKIVTDTLPTSDIPVAILKTAAFADATGEVTGVTFTVNGVTVDGYYLSKTADAVNLCMTAKWTTVTEVTTTGATSWSALMARLAANHQTLANNATLIIDFGSEGGEPGTFTFDGDATLGTVKVIGSNGGTITKSGTVTVSATRTVVNTNVEIAQNAMTLGNVTLAEGCTLTVNDANALGTAANFSATETSTVKLVNVNNSNLNLANLASSGTIVLNNVKAYLYDCTIGTLTLEGDYQINNGTTTKTKTQCITVNELAGSGTFKGPTGAEYCSAFNVKDWANFTGSIDLSHEKSKNTIFFFGEAPDYFATAAGNANTANDAQEYFANDYGTVYVTADKTVATASTSTWKLQKLVVEEGGSFQINGWATIASSCTGTVTVENGGVLDLRSLTDAQLTAINVTVNAGGRVLVNTGATVSDNIVFAEGAILGVATTHVEDVGNATLTVNVNGTAATKAKINGYHTDGVTLLEGWKKNDETSSEGSFKFNFDPVFDGELCWWAYEFDGEVNTTADANIGPISTGRDKARMSYDAHNNSNRHCEGDEYVVTSDEGKEPVAKAIRMASGPYRSANYPKAFTLAMYGTVTSNLNRILFGVGSTAGGTSKYAVVLTTGASANEVALRLVQGHQGNNNNYLPNPVKTLAVTTVPNAATEYHLYAFSYEYDSVKNQTEIIFYVDGEKYQPYKVEGQIVLGAGFQMGTTHGGCPPGLTRMNEEDRGALMEYLRVYDQILPESVLTAMANEYSYVSKVGKATRTIVAGEDTTWHETSLRETSEGVNELVGDWHQWTAVKNEAGAYVYDTDGNLTFTEADVYAPTYGDAADPEKGTQVFLDVNGDNTLYLNEFYSNPMEEGENSKLYYERLEVNSVNGTTNDIFRLYAGRKYPTLNGAESRSSAVITVLGYSKINTDVVMANNVAYLSGPVAVAEGKTLTFDFTDFDVMMVPTMPAEYRLTGFLDEETRTRVKSIYPGEPKNARSVDLGYKTNVNQYTFLVDRYPVTATFTRAEGGKNNNVINFNEMYYKWQGSDPDGQQMDWDAVAANVDGTTYVENTLKKFGINTTVTLATNDEENVALTLNESALKKEIAPAGTDGEGNPIDAVVEDMLGEQQLIVADKVTVDYTGTDAAELAPFVKAVDGMVRVANSTFNSETYTTWPGNLTIAKGGTLSGTGTVAGKLVFEETATFDARTATADTCLSAKDADLVNLKAITVNVDAVDAAGVTGLRVLKLAEGHTAKSLIGCTVTAVNDDDKTVATWTESGAKDPTLVVVRADGLYVVGRPDVMADTTKVINDALTLPLARRAAELSATSLNITAVKSLDGKTTITTDASVIAGAAECFTGIAFDVDKAVNSDIATATLRYDFGVTDIAMVTDNDGTEYVVVELVVSNYQNYADKQNTADFADRVTVDVSVTKDDKTQELELVAVANMGGSTTDPVTSGNKRYIRFPMPDGNGTFKVKARAIKQ